MYATQSHRKEDENEKRGAAGEQRETSESGGGMVAAERQRSGTGANGREHRGHAPAGENQ